jgi:hypothetical protein
MPVMTMTRRHLALSASAVALVVFLSPLPGHAAPDDAYLAGYAAAVLQRELHLGTTSLRVEHGVIELPMADVGQADAGEVRRVLATIPGVTGVRFVERPSTREVGEDATPASRLERRDAVTRENGFLPPGELFAPLLADPRWPRFSAAYRYYRHDSKLGSVGAANFGASLPLYRGDASFPDRAQWEAGVQTGVFSIFNLDAKSKDLINSDFFVALFGSYRAGDFSVLGRVLHQSSHLGDEFLLNNPVQRVNLSYEGIDVKLSYDLFDDDVRVYGGGGYLFDRDPTSLDPAVVEYGVEVTSPWTLRHGTILPVAAVDFQNTQETNWSTQYSVLGGMRFEHLRLANTALLLGLEWFRGHSPNGQFYRQKVEWVGFGAHFYF